MQTRDAERSRSQWGDKPCTHQNPGKEYYLGSQTGDYACGTCGETWASRSEWREARREALEKYGGEKPCQRSPLSLHDRAAAGLLDGVLEVAGVVVTEDSRRQQVGGFVFVRRFARGVFKLSLVAEIVPVLQKLREMREDVRW